MEKLTNKHMNQLTISNFVVITHQEIRLEESLQLNNLYIKEVLRITNLMDMVSFNLKMETDMKVILKMDYIMEMVSMKQSSKAHIMVNLEMGYTMVKVFSDGDKILYMKENTVEEVEMDLANS